MFKPFAFALAAVLALLAAAASRADETFPVIHNEPITVRILNGKSGQPLAHFHLILIGGYDQGEIADHLWQEEMLTDEQGRVRLSGQLANLPWLRVELLNGKLCQVKPESVSFSVERIRRDGLSAPNRCGIITAPNAPGLFTVFVKSKGSGKSMMANLLTLHGKTHPPATMPAGDSRPAKIPPQPAEAVVKPALPQPAAAVSAAPLPPPDPPDAFLLTPLPILPGTPLPHVTAFAPPPATRTANKPPKTLAKRRHAHRPRQLLTVCQTPPPEAKTAPRQPAPAKPNPVAAKKTATPTKPEPSAKK
jgi:hypothetical protein